MRSRPRPPAGSADRVGVELPIAEAVRAVVAGEQGVDAAIDALLARPLPFSE